MSIFVLYIVEQVNKFLHLIVTPKKIDQMKFLNLIPYQRVFEKLKSYLMKIWIIIVFI